MKTASDIKQFIQPKDLDWIALRSFKNCHYKGLHSFVINESPLVRVFILDKDVSLDWNYKVGQDIDIKNLIIPIGYHQHRNFSRLIINTGAINNFSAIENFNNDFKSHKLYKFLFESAIINHTKNAVVKSDGVKNFRLLETELLHETAGRTYVDINSKVYHTVGTPFKYIDTYTSWFVIEGKPNPEFDNSLYTTLNIEQLNKTLENLYQPVLTKEIKFYFEQVGLTEMILEV